MTDKPKAKGTYTPKAGEPNSKYLLKVYKDTLGKGNKSSKKGKK